METADGLLGGRALAILTTKSIERGATAYIAREVLDVIAPYVIYVNRW